VANGQSCLIRRMEVINFPNAGIRVSGVLVRAGAGTAAPRVGLYRFVLPPAGQAILKKYGFAAR